MDRESPRFRQRSRSSSPSPDRRSRSFSPRRGGVLLTSETDPDTVRCTATGITATRAGAGLYRAHGDGSLHVWAGDRLVPASEGHTRVAFGFRPINELPPLDTPVVETYEERRGRSRSRSPSPDPRMPQIGGWSPYPSPSVWSTDRDRRSRSPSRDRSRSRSRERDRSRSRSRSPSPDYRMPRRSEYLSRGAWSRYPSRGERSPYRDPRSRSPSPVRGYPHSSSSGGSSSPTAPVGGPRSPWTSPGGTTRARSPGGRTYRRGAPGGRRVKESRRNAGGYVNPSHRHGAMIPLWLAAANTPPRPGASQAQVVAHLMDRSRTFTVTSPGGSRTRQVTGHGSAVLGHRPSASTHWNDGGHRAPRAENLAHNRSAAAYHGIEDRDWSNASGASEPRYLSPRPDRGSHPSYFNPDDPDFGGGPWPTWRWEPPPGGGGSGTAT